MESRLTDRHDEILQFIRGRAGCSVQEVIDYMNGEEMLGEHTHSSQMTTRKCISELKEWGMLNVRGAQGKGAIKRLYFNDQKGYNKVIQEIKDFRRAFIILLRDVEATYKLEFRKAGNAEGDDLEKIIILQDKLNTLRHQTVALYKMVFQCYTSMSITDWPTQFEDKEELRTIYATVFPIFAEMHSRVLEVAPPSLVSSVEFDAWQASDYYGVLKEYKLNEKFETMLSAIKTWDLRQMVFGEVFGETGIKMYENVRSGKDPFDGIMVHEASPGKKHSGKKRLIRSKSSTDILNPNKPLT